MTRKNKIAILIMLLIGLAIFGYEARSLNFNDLAGDISQLNVWWLLVALFCMLLSWAFEAIVVQVFLKGRVAFFPFRNAYRVPLVEQLFNAITPFSSGGQPGQLIALMQSKVEAGRASSILLMKFVVFQFMVLINFVFTLMIGFDKIAANFSALSWFIIFGFVIHVVVIVGLLMIMYYYKFTKKLVQVVTIPLKWFMKPAKVLKLRVTLDEKIDTFYAESLHLKREKKKVVIAAILTFIQLLFYYSVPYFVILALGYHHVDFIAVMVMHVMIVMIVSLFPIPGGSGGAEFSFKALFATFIPSASKLILGMLLWRIFTYYLGMLLGIVAMAIKPKQAPESMTMEDTKHDD